MFKRYVLKREDGINVDFFVHAKATRNGFMHRACVIGLLPRLDGKDDDWARYKHNDDKLYAKRVARASYLNRTWESWPGQTVLVKLWDQLAELKFIDMSRISKTNPFEDAEEPVHEELFDPEDLFRRFSRRR